MFRFVRFRSAADLDTGIPVGGNQPPRASMVGPGSEDAEAVDSTRSGSGSAEASLAAVALLVTLILGIGWQGAYYRGGQLALGLGLVCVVGASGAARRFDRGELLWPPAVAVVLLGAWIPLNAILHGTPGLGLGGGALAVAAAVTLVVVRRLEPSDRALLVAALPVVGALAAMIGWLGLVLHRPAWSQEAQGLWRAAGTLTYSNALAATLVPLALIAVADTARPSLIPSGSGPRLVPVPVTRLLAMIMVTGVLATLSRGGVLALLVGFVVLVATGGWAMVRAAIGPLAGAAVGFAGLVPSLSVDGSVVEGPVARVIAVGGLTGGLIVTHLAAGFLERSASTTRWRQGAGWAGLVGVALVATALGPRLQAIAEVRLSSGSNYRAQAAEAALSLFAKNPLLGTGPGGAVTTWQDSSGASVTLRYLHNEYLQVLVEHGVIGASLLVAVMAAGVRAARHSRRAATDATGPTPITRNLPTGGVAAVGAFALSSAVDIPWHLPGLPVLMATLFALTLSVPHDHHMTAN